MDKKDPFRNAFIICVELELSPQDYLQLIKIEERKEFVNSWQELADGLNNLTEEEIVLKINTLAVSYEGLKSEFAMFKHAGEGQVKFNPDLFLKIQQKERKINPAIVISNMVVQVSKQLALTLELLEKKEKNKD